MSGTCKKYISQPGLSKHWHPALLEDLLQFSFEPMFILRNDCIIRANPAGAELLGLLDASEVMGFRFEHIVCEDTRKNYMHGMSQLTKTQNEVEIKGIRIHTRSRGTIDVNMRCMIAENEGKEYRFLFCHDVSLQKALEEHYKDSEERYKRLVRISPEPIIVHCNMNLVYINVAAMKLLGIEDECEVVGKSILGFFRKADREVARRRIKLAVSQELIDFKEYEFIRRDGHILTVELGSSLVSLYSDVPLVQSVIRDITERKKTEEMLRKSEKLSAIGQLAAGVAHEIRNPLTALKGFVQLLYTKNEKYKRYYEIMQSELERIHKIVNEFMVLSRPTPSVIALHDIRAILDDIMMVLKTQAALTDVHIVAKLQPDLPSITCDENQIKQVLVNIIKNAIEAMPDGGELYVGVTCHTSDQLDIVIRDSGSGIPENVLSRLGEPFFTTKDNGTGLGLMISERIIQAHKGQMHIDSMENAGTTVHITLPVNMQQV